METTQLLDDTQVVEINPQYRVVFEPGEFLIIRAGLIKKTPFKHPNIIRQHEKKFEFRTYYRSGHKRWYSREGTQYYFVVPKGHIFVVHEEGYSYVPVMIGGKKFSLNVSGGTTNGWTDWVGNSASISVNHLKRDLKSLADQAIPLCDVPDTILDMIERQIKRDK